MNSRETVQASTAIERYEVLASPEARHLVRLLADQPAPLTPAALAVVRAVEAHDGDPADVSEATIRRHRIDLVHRDLPRAADSGLVEFDGDAVTVTDEAVAAVAALTAAIPESERGTDLLDVLTDDRRRRVIAVLARAPHETVTLTGLAVTVTTVEEDTALADLDRGRLAAVRSTLHHVHLPKLADAGLLEYDPERRTVTDVGTDTIDATWVGDVGRVPRPSTDGGRRVPSGPAADVWTIDEHESITERTRALADHADEELVVVLTADGLLTTDCLTHLRLATERGVDVVVATPVESVRTRVRDEVPKATTWEPQHGWLAPLAGERGRLSRLVVADRRAALLATTDDDPQGESAVTGDGRDNGLVAAVRALLRDGLDADGTREPDTQSPASP